MSAETLVLILLGASVAGIVIGILMFVFQVGSDSIFTPLIVFVVGSQIGSPAGYLVIWYLKIFQGWRVPMWPLVIGSVVAGVLIMLVIGEQIWFKVSRPPMWNFTHTKVIPGDKHPLAGLSNEWLPFAFAIYNVCNVIITAPLVWLKLFGT